MVSSILPKNERWDNFQYIKLSQHSFLGRIEDTINCFRDLLTFITRWKNVIFKIPVSKIFVFEWSFLQYFHFHFRNVSDNSIEIEGARLYTLCRRIIKVSFWTSSEFTSLHCDMPGFRFRHGRKNVKHCALCWCAKTLFKSYAKLRTKVNFFM